MPELTYYLFNLIVLVPVLLLSIFSDVQPHKEIRRLLKCFVLVSLPFIYWDIWAASEGHWGFSDTYITDFRVIGLPIEEILFFITVPFACIFVWEALNKHYKTMRKVSKNMALSIFIMTSVLALPVLFANWSNGYTRSALIAFLIMLVAYFVSGRQLATRRQFWVYQLIVLGLFLIANSVLTALPVIFYGPEAIIGFRIGTIPIEDFFFNFALINLWLLVWETSNQPRVSKTR